MSFVSEIYADFIHSIEMLFQTYLICRHIAFFFRPVAIGIHGKRSMLNNMKCKTKEVVQILSAIKFSTLSLLTISFPIVSSSFSFFLSLFNVRVVTRFYFFDLKLVPRIQTISAVLFFFSSKASSLLDLLFCHKTTESFQKWAF